MNNTTQDELTEQVARAIHQAEIDYGNTELEPFDELNESTLGLAMAYAHAVIPVVRAAAWQEFSEAIWSEETLQKAGMMGQGITRTEWSGMTEKEQGRVRQIAGWYIGPALTIIAPSEDSHE